MIALVTAPLLFPVLAAATQRYNVSVLDRSLTGAPLLQYPATSFAPNTLNPSWLPIPGHKGGALFFRVMAPPAGSGCPGFDCIGLVFANSSDGLHYPPATAEMLLRDAPPGLVHSTDSLPHLNRLSAAVVKHRMSTKAGALSSGFGVFCQGVVSKPARVCQRLRVYPYTLARAGYAAPLSYPHTFALKPPTLPYLDTSRCLSVPQTPGLFAY